MIFWKTGWPIRSMMQSVWYLPFVPPLPTMGSCRSTFLLVQIVRCIPGNLLYNRGFILQSMLKCSEKLVEVVPWRAEVFIIVHAKRYMRKSWRNVTAVWLSQLQGFGASSRCPASTVCPRRCRCLHPQLGLQWWAGRCPFFPHQTEMLVFSAPSFLLP